MPNNSLPQVVFDADSPILQLAVLILTMLAKRLLVEVSERWIARKRHKKHPSPTPKPSRSLTPLDPA